MRELRTGLLEIASFDLDEMFLKWKICPYSITANRLNGIAKLVDTYGDSLKDNVFRKAQQGICQGITRDAKASRVGALEYAEVRLMQYNMRKTNNLLQREK